MDLNKFNYYRANPYAHNDYIPTASMANRIKKQFPSQIPQGEEHLTARPGKRIFKDKVELNQIQKDNILISPQKYPYENRIALEKSYPRNLDTLDIEGATAGTKVSESIRNKHKALEQLRRKYNQQIKSPLIGQSLDEVYQKKKRQMAQKIQKNIQMRKAKQPFTPNESNSKQTSLENSRNSKNDNRDLKSPNNKLQVEYERFVSHNSNNKYNRIVPNLNQFQTFQLQKRPENTFQTLEIYNNGRIPNRIDNQDRFNQENNDRYSTIDMDRHDPYQFNSNTQTNNRGSSIDFSQVNENNSSKYTANKQPSYLNNGYISINNRHRSNPEYIDKFSDELQKRVEETQKNKKIEENLKNIYQNDRVEFRRHNPTNLSFNIAAKSALMGPII